ncbi:uncharacterized protein K460DRAFT_359835 [Cucurbitaria berberidis CBS 394.84]|uniref:Uncharacterized protein n=1 Tax=Cucurbitaria berberidis CBS 394.84 TaxID=1168544 RepID=A0A9P4L3B1_9PLEO|nr:uncharacterized protein K460DRAFT_359835 [Cucurbitaria berberidis CBS 394.84]KAF1840112.1 hypothetical protein K460DRAFT_359835 [Cucurbitaria berberidis CBS 394.84]
MSRPGDEITSDDALTLALQVVLSSDLSVEQCSALIAKLEKNGKAQVADIVAKTTAAHEGLVDLSNWAPMKLWQQIKNSLTAWEIAWYSNLPQGKVGKYRRSLSATQRQLAQRNLPAVDLTALPTIQSDFVFMLAYAGIEPLSADVLDAVWSKCSAYAATGTRIRSLMEAFMRGDKHLGRWVDQPSKKRSQSEIEGEMNGIQSE